MGGAGHQGGIAKNFDRAQRVLLPLASRYTLKTKKSRLKKTFAQTVERIVPYILVFLRFDSVFSLKKRKRNQCNFCADFRGSSKVTFGRTYFTI